MKKINLCPVCSGKNIRSFFTASSTHGREMLSGKEKFQYVRCVTCSSIFLIDVTVNTAFYKKFYTFDKVKEATGSVRFLEKVISVYSQKRKQGILQLYKGNGETKIVILDVGCGTGEFLANLDEKKYEKCGIELDKQEFAISQRRGLKVYNENILKKNFNNKKFDIITLWHVVEHIPDPQALMRKIDKLLAKNGIVIMATPNSDSLGFRMAKANWFHMDAPRHLILFNSQGIRMLCRKFGYTIKKIRCETFEFPLDLFWSVKKVKIQPLIYLFYPLIKYFDRETLTYVIKKSHKI